MSDKNASMSQRKRLSAMWKVAVLTYKAAPMAVFLQVFTSVLNAVLPIVTTYFAALTTTALAEAFNGDVEATSRVFVYLAITALLGVVTSIWGTFANYISQTLRYKVQIAVSGHMFTHFLRLDFWRYDDKETVDTYDKASQFANSLQYIFERLANILGYFISFMTGLIALVLVNWWLGLILLVAIIPGVIIQFQLSRVQARHWKQNVDTRRAISIIEWEMLRRPDLMAELRLYSMARYLLDLWMKLRDKDEKKRIEFEKKYIAKRLISQIIEAAAEVTALVWTVIQIANHALPIGQFIFVQQVVSRTLEGISNLTNAINTIDEDLANLVEYQKFLDMPEETGNGRLLPEMERSLKVDNVSFAYPNSSREVLKNVTLEIQRGKHVAIVGENGAGKSTLVKVISGLYRPVIGKVLVDDQDLADYDISSWHKALAVLQQKYIEFGFATARENVYFGDVSKPYSQKRFDAAIDQAEARNFLEKLPQGFETYVWTWMEDTKGNKGVELSGGQWQRLALARNFYRDSPVIILDEPTSAIDALAESRIFKHLFGQKQKTVIAISHRLSTVKKADWIYMMKDGEIVEQGEYGDLVAAKGEFYRMFESQL